MESCKQCVDGAARKRCGEIWISVLALLLATAFLLVFFLSQESTNEPKEAPAAAATFDNSLSLVLTPQTGDSRTDKEISRLQQQIRNGRNLQLGLEQLGWAFVTKARERFDPGFYKLAEQCARLIEMRNSQSQEAMLLRAHVLQNLHRFKESETLARRLVQQRGLSFDYGLLGDALMEQGKLNDAVGAYQQMMNLKPDLRAYARAAHLRWLKGDLTGAIEAMQLAVSAASPQDAESAAWVNTRLAFYEFQAGHVNEAEQRCAFALSVQSSYAPTLLLKGRMLLAQSRFGESVHALQSGLKLNPLPEYQWTLAEALRVAGKENEASEVEAQLCQRGASNDPRTLALYLATRHESPETALRLARAELDSRSDVFTHDALAWSLAAAGKVTEAHSEMQRALAEGTQDARLFFHAGVIASQAGHSADAERWLRKASELSHLLLPSERNELQNAAAGGAEKKAAVATNPQKPFSLGPNTARKTQPQTKT
ncbi:MAG TPA: tetratricopeptide repeat protein [Candidatus Udaeobacter sp.]|nr:tetratricopeptide repeat protein [Candidatus Udaeobacter sp.]